MPAPRAPGADPTVGGARGFARGLVVADEVAAAVRAGRPVVALESTIISHGLPRPGNLEIARRVEQAVRDAGAVPATVAVLDGRIRVGLDEPALRRVAAGTGMVKVSVRDLATVVARSGDGATTVAATCHIAHLAGIAVFATGGLGGVHRAARDSWDESADLTTLGVTPITVVCAGVKSILDVAATLERLETLNVAVLGYRTDVFPGFYLVDSGQRLDYRVDSPQEVAAVMAARTALRLTSALVVANPLPAEDAVDRDLHDQVLARALTEAAEQGVTGKAVTPFLLDRFHQGTAGASVAANTAIILANARLAAQIASAAAPPPAPVPV